MSIPDILDKIIQIDEFKNFINLMDSPHVYPTITMYGYPWEKSKDWNDLISLLEQNKDFEKFNNKMQQLGSSANRVYLKDLAVWLTVRSYKVGVKQAIIEVKNYCSEKEVTVYVVMLLLNIRPDESFTFSNGVQIVNEKSIPSQRITKDIWHNLVNSPLPFPNVQSVLIHPLKHEVIHENNPDLSQTNKVIYDNYDIVIKKMEDVKECLILSRNLYGVHSMAHGIIAPDNLPFISKSSGWYLESLKSPSFSPHLLKIELENANKFLQSFEKLDSKLKEKLKVSIERLNSYCARSTIVEQSVSLRTCLESVFLDDGNKEQLRYRLSLRAALYLGKDLEDRKKIMNIMKKTYDITSTAVHEGRLKEKQLKEIKLLDETAILVRKAIIKILVEGKKIDWELLELR